MKKVFVAAEDFDRVTPFQVSKLYLDAPDSVKNAVSVLLNETGSFILSASVFKDADELLCAEHTSTEASVILQTSDNLAHVLLLNMFTGLDESLNGGSPEVLKDIIAVWLYRKGHNYLTEIMNKVATVVAAENPSADEKH